MRRKHALGAPAAGSSLGIPTPLLVGGVLAALGLAWLNSGSGAADAAAPAGSSPAPSGGGSTSPSRPTTPASSPATTNPSTPKRRAVKKAASPLLYVFVNSVGGEGIFDRLRNSAVVVDGNGLTRIATLDNHEYAGLATGVQWTAPDTGNVYIQLYEEVNGVGYNYWIQQKETTALHAQAAYTTYGWGDNSRMSATHRAQIAQFYFQNYIL